MSITIERTMTFAPARTIERPVPEPEAVDRPRGRVPRVARLLALAHRIDDLVRRGEVADYAAVAAAGGVTRARVSQIVGLLNLAPDIQIEILGLPLVVEGRDPISEHDLRPIAKEDDWGKQRAMWRRLDEQPRR